MARTGARKSTITLAVVLTLLLVVGAMWAYVFSDFRTASGDGVVATTPSTTVSSSTTPAQAEGEWTMGDARKALAGEGSRTLVLGDSTGDGYDEWVHLWAGSQGLPVASWLTQSESGYESESEDTRVWSGSMPEATAAYPLERWDEIWPAEDPDLVVLNFGHAHESPEEATKALEELRADVAERVEDAPIVVVLQNPEAQDADEETREAIADWADEEGLPTIDIAKAFKDSGQPPEDLRLDDLNPSGAGSQLWADAVGKALG